VCVLKCRFSPSVILLVNIRSFLSVYTFSLRNPPILIMLLLFWWTRLHVKTQNRYFILKICCVILEKQFWFNLKLTVTQVFYSVWRIKSKISELGYTCVCVLDAVRMRQQFIGTNLRHNGTAQHHTSQSRQVLHQKRAMLACKHWYCIYKCFCDYRSHDQAVFLNNLPVK